jgi:hypothetical protein
VEASIAVLQFDGRAVAGEGLLLAALLLPGITALALGFGERGL